MAARQQVGMRHPNYLALSASLSCSSWLRSTAVLGGGTTEGVGFSCGMAKAWETTHCSACFCWILHLGFGGWLFLLLMWFNNASDSLFICFVSSELVTSSSSFTVTLFEKFSPFSTTVGMCLCFSVAVCIPCQEVGRYLFGSGLQSYMANAFLLHSKRVTPALKQFLWFLSN